MLTVSSELYMYLKSAKQSSFFLIMFKFMALTLWLCVTVLRDLEFPTGRALENPKGILDSSLLM